MKHLDEIELYRQEQGSEPVIVMGYLRPELYGQILILHINLKSSSVYGYIKPGMTLSRIEDIIQRTLDGRRTVIRVLDTTKDEDGEKGVYLGYSKISMVTRGLVAASGKSIPRINKESDDRWVSVIVTRPEVFINVKMTTNSATLESCYGKRTVEINNKKKKRTC